MPQRTNRRVLLRTLPGWIVVTALISCGAPAAVAPAPDSSAQPPVPEEGVRPRTPPTEPMIHPEPEAEEAVEAVP
ncbi:MAG: hypothetical protein VX815_14540, partial [Gemmatimonadota bacterium]|nr:hypothetical protein [Gemmatimonadota bacterium]